MKTLTSQGCSRSHFKRDLSGQWFRVGSGETPHPTPPHRFFGLTTRLRRESDSNCLGLCWFGLHAKIPAITEQIQSHKLSRGCQKSDRIFSIDFLKHGLWQRLRSYLYKIEDFIFRRPFQSVLKDKKHQNLLERLSKPYYKPSNGRKRLGIRFFSDQKSAKIRIKILIL